MGNVLLVVDMVVGFLEPGHNLFCGDKARDIIPDVRELIDQETKSGSEVIFVNDNHQPDDLEFEMFPVHCLVGTDETLVIPELREFASTVIPKNRYSAFYGTALEQELALLKPDKVIICGVCTDICILHTTTDARNRDYKVEIRESTIASFDEEAHDAALKHMETILGAGVIRDL